MNTSLYSPQLKAILSAQEELRPSPAVKTRLMAKISPQVQTWVQPTLQWAMSGASALAVAVLAMLVLWTVVQPGVVLEWSGSPNTTTKVYRASKWDGDLQLLAETDPVSQTTQYKLTDSWLIPSMTYTYVIEGRNAQVVQSIPIRVKSIETFVSQITILLTSLILGYGMLKISQEMPLSPRKTIQL